MFKVLSFATVALVLSAFGAGCATATDGPTGGETSVYEPVTDEAQETNSGETEEVARTEAPLRTDDRLAPVPSPTPAGR